MAELIASGDTLNVGRIAINTWYTGSTNVWSGLTNGSIRAFNGGNTVGAGVVYGLVAGKTNNASAGAYSTILNGSGNTASNNFTLIGNGRTNVTSGIYSVVLSGRQNTASGSRSMILNGKYNTASNTYSTVLNGLSNSATGARGLILGGGSNTVASSFGFVAQGFNNNVASTATYSTILNGSTNSILGTTTRGFIHGSLNVISAAGNHPTIINASTSVVSAPYGTVINGFNNQVLHDYSLAIGKGVRTTEAYTMVFAFTDTPTNNTIKFNFQTGTLYHDNATYGGAADYAECFEWEDGNPENDKRYGYAVSLSNDGKIKIGNDNLIGIVSSTPMIIGDSGELSWKEKFVTDEWGINQTVEFEKLSTAEGQFFRDKDGVIYKRAPLNNKQKEFFLLTEEFDENKVTKKEQVSFALFRDDYDFEKTYLPRSQRKEWATIGLLGKLRLRTSEKITGKFVDINSRGMAVNGKKYTVLKTIKEFDGEYGIVYVYFK